MSTVKERLALSLLTHRVRVGRRTYKRWLILPNWFRRPEPRYEPEVTAVYEAILARKQGAVLDVGANKGQTMTKLLGIDSERQYFGFEPQCMAAASVEGFLIDNQVANYFMFPIALSDRNGPMPMKVKGSGLLSTASCTASLVDGFRPEEYYSYSRYVYAARGDDVIESLGLRAVALVKIDAEGGELEVIRGLEQTIAAFRPVLTFEVLPPTLRGVDGREQETVMNRSARQQELDALLRSMGYCIYQVVSNNRTVKVAAIDPKLMSERNFIAVPEEDDVYFSRLWHIAAA